MPINPPHYWKMLKKIKRVCALNRTADAISYIWWPGEVSQEQKNVWRFDECQL